MYDRNSGIIHTVMDCTSNLRKTVSLSIRFTANKKTNKTIYFRIPLYRYVMRVGTKYRFLDYTSILETQSNLFIYEFSHSFLVEYKIRSLRGIYFQRSITIYNNAKNWRKKGGCFFCYLFWYLSLVFLWIIWKFHTNDSYLFSNRIHWSCLGLCFSKNKINAITHWITFRMELHTQSNFFKRSIRKSAFYPCKRL